MSIRHTILGFLSWKPFSGYELKKLFSDSLSFYWTGNNNQIYGSLVELHREGAVEIEVQQQEKRPARKVYSITPKGREELKAWLISEPELPVVRNLFHTRLAWSASLGEAELMKVIADYESLLEAQLLMCRESARRGNPAPNRNARERFIWGKIEEGLIAYYERELEWTRTLALGVAKGGDSDVAAGDTGGAARGAGPGSQQASRN